MLSLAQVQLLRLNQLLLALLQEEVLMQQLGVGWRAYAARISSSCTAGQRELRQERLGALESLTLLNLIVGSN